MNGIANHRIYVKLSYEEVSAEHLCVYSDHLAFLLAWSPGDAEHSRAREPARLAFLQNSEVS